MLMRITVFALPKTRRKLIFGVIAILLALLIFPVLRASLKYLEATQHEEPVTGGLPLMGKTFVIDPGHGGYDPGVWCNDVEEKIVVLGISLALRDYLQSSGARVVMTRESDRDLLVLPTAGPKKKQDMKNRLNIIKDANPDLLISVHANSISSSIWHGAQVFYNPDCDASKMLAELIQQELARVLDNTDRMAKPGNYLILNEVDMPAIIVETGFISNPREAALLTDPEYQSKVAWSIYLGIIRQLDVQVQPSS
jgi:N-acetylmuramoyl-L-alanine amidase